MKKKISVFAGTACNKEKEPYYFDLAYQTGKLLAEAGYIVMTGAGSGLMSEALRGAYENGGETVGVMLEKEGIIHSPYVTQKFMFEKLGPRQDKLIELADGYITLPGGVGTLYETIEILTMKRVGEIESTKPLILIDKYYENLQNLFVKVIDEGFVTETLHTYFRFAPEPPDAVTFLDEHFQTTQKEI